MIPRQALEEDTETQKYMRGNAVMSLFLAKDRRVVMYPTNDNSEMKLAAFHPSNETSATVIGIMKPVETSRNQLLEVFQDFDSSIQAILDKADSHTLKLWNLLDMNPLPTFVLERLAIIGDAHPFLPFQGQGGGMPIENGACLAAVLPWGVTPDEIQERLQLYNSARYERAHRIQHLTRLVGRDTQDGTKINVSEFIPYCFGHDEWEHSTKILQQYTMQLTSGV
jgi:2-polyprenyl-6-methoxyphenol hydroxylase-like FAD-dependent oxidoreductase